MKYIVVKAEELGLISIDLKKRKIINQRQIERLLRKFKINYKAQEIKKNEVIKFVCESGVEIIFDYDEEENSYIPDTLCLKESDFKILSEDNDEFNLFFDDIKL